MRQLDRIKELRRAGRVKRFHTLDTIIPDNVAIHSLNVVLTLIVMGEATADRILLAIEHDLPERRTGDIPSPLKRLIRADTTAVDLEEVSWLGDYLPTADHHTIPTQRDIEVLKIADNLDGLLKCTEEVRLGNQDLMKVGLTYCEYLAEHAHVELVSEAISEFKKVYKIKYLEVVQ
jgi:5'-deoxynucleotidase YfbR-like HD superfamily hydrolase